MPAFDRVAFALPKNTLSKPVKTQYGFHLIEPLSDVKPRRTTPLAKVEQQISQQLLLAKKIERSAKWVQDAKKELAAETEYQVGYALPASATVTGGTTATDR